MELTNVEQQVKIERALLFIRVTVFLVMFMWTLDKFLNPSHGINVYEKFYFIAGISDYLMYGLAVIEMIIITLFLLGIQKTYTYGAVLLFHSVSTLSAFAVYLSPFEGAGLLFFAAWPMLAACFALFTLREHDKLLVVGD